MLASTKAREDMEQAPIILDNEEAKTEASQKAVTESENNETKSDKEWGQKDNENEEIRLIRRLIDGDYFFKYSDKNGGAFKPQPSDGKSLKPEALYEQLNAYLSPDNKYKDTNRDAIRNALGAVGMKLLSQKINGYHIYSAIWTDSYLNFEKAELRKLLAGKSGEYRLSKVIAVFYTVINIIKDVVGGDPSLVLDIGYPITLNEESLSDVELTGLRDRVGLLKSSLMRLDNNRTISSSYKDTKNNKQIVLNDLRKIFDDVLVKSGIYENWENEPDTYRLTAKGFFILQKHNEIKDYCVQEGLYQEGEGE